MRQSILAAALIAALCGTAAYATQDSHAGHSATASAALDAAIAASGRSAANRARDQYRHPAETLSFFGVEPGNTVVELIPGGGWYTEILAPYLAANGKLYVAQAPGGGADRLKAKFAADPAYAKVIMIGFPSEASEIPSGSADVVLTFRNLHNLTMRGDGTDTRALARAFDMLKPGGTFGVVEHRLPEDRDVAAEKDSGYLKTSTVRRIVEAAGFEFVEASEVNANPKDTADHPKGVWTLPPNFREGDATRAKYAAIGESDRMTLKFRKPANQ